MEADVKWLRAQVAQRGPRRRGARVAPAVRAAIATYARQALARGATLGTIAAALDVAPESIRRWTQRGAPPHRPSRLLPVVLAPAPSAHASGVTVTAPGGYRVDGLTVPEVATLLRALA